MVAMGAQLDATLEGVIANLLAGGPQALKESKDLIRSVSFRPQSDALTEETASLIARIRASKEGKEGISAFLEKRKPGWAGDN